MKFDLKSPSRFIKAMARAIKHRICYGSVVMSNDEIDSRLAQCYTCHRQKDGQCLQCNCFVSVKAMLRSETCPLDRWRN